MVGVLVLRTSLRGGACSAIALSAFFAFSAPALAADFTVPAGTTSGGKTVTNNDIGTIESGGAISAATGIIWSAGASSPGVIIDNSGTITGTTRGIDASGFTSGSLTLNNKA